MLAVRDASSQLPAQLHAWGLLLCLPAMMHYMNCFGHGILPQEKNYYYAKPGPLKTPFVVVVVAGVLRQSFSM